MGMVNNVKYHINPETGRPNICRAKIKCDFDMRAEEHFSTKEQAQAFIENKYLNSKESNIFAGKKKEHNEHNELTENNAIPDTLSAEISRQYAHLALDHNHMHDSTDIGNDIELLYYSSPQGQLELQRRSGIIEINGFNDDKYEKIKEKLQTFNHDEMNYTIDNLEEKIKEGENSYNKEWLEENNDNGNPLVFSTKTFMTELKPLRHHLIEQSYTWLNKLTTEQQESISALTSDYFYILQIANEDKGITDEKSNELYDNYVFNNYINEKEYYDKYSPDYDMADKKILEAKRELAHTLKTNVTNAFNNAPVLETPIMTYRGTTLDEIKEIVNLDSNSSDEELIDKLNNGVYNGVDINNNSRINNIPVSSSISPSRAERFGDDVIIVIKRKTMTSPVNVSAWGTSELEVLTNPQSQYVIHSSFHDTTNDRTVIQLEEQLKG